MDTSYETKDQSVEWYTPPHVVRALGKFDLDPCAPSVGNDFTNRFEPNVYATHKFTKKDDGLEQEWTGRVWMNPPYGRETAAWLKKLSLHQDGIAMVFARTDTSAFHQHVWGKASGIFFMKGRTKFWRWTEENGGHFYEGNGRAGAPSVLVAYDREDEFTNSEALKQSGLPGYFVDLTPTEVVWAGWKVALRSILEFGPLTLQELYHWVEKCVHRPENKHIQAKVRQTLRRYDELFEESTKLPGHWQLKEY